MEVLHLKFTKLPTTQITFTILYFCIKYDTVSTILKLYIAVR